MQIYDQSATQKNYRPISYIKEMWNVVFWVGLMLGFIIFTLTRFRATHMVGGSLSDRVGPVDMLQMPKQRLMDGYRFQNAMYPPRADNLFHPSDCNPIHRQRVGIFKEKAYIDQEGGHEGASHGTISQLMSIGEQDRHIIGRPNDPIIDIEKHFGPWLGYTRPEKYREINYPNQVFSWGDVIQRYANNPEINL